MDLLNIATIESNQHCIVPNIMWNMWWLVLCYVLDYVVLVMLCHGLE